MKTQNKGILLGVKNKLKKYSIVFSVFIFPTCYMFGQTRTYDNFEGMKYVTYASKSGMLDTMAMNPAPGKVNNSKKCAKYVRKGTEKYDNIKMVFAKKLMDVSTYATYAGMPPKLSMKIYTTAPVGTLVEIQLGKQGNNNYPQGVNSKFQAYTTVSNAWEELQFKFAETPKGSETASTEVDQISILFNPNSLTAHTYYFDDVTGPDLVSDKFGSLGMPLYAPEKEGK